MPVYTLQTDSGRTYDIEAPTPEAAAQAATYAESQRSPASRGQGTGGGIGGRAPSTAGDVIRAGVSGVVQGAAALGNQQNDAANAGGHAGVSAVAALARLTGHPDLADNVERIGGQTIEGAAPSTSHAIHQGHAAGADYQPQTTAGRVVQRGARLLPAAAMPGSIPMRIASVALPFAGGEIGRKIDTSLGGNGDVGGAAGEIVGGALTGIRIAHIRPPAAGETAAETAARVLTDRGGRGATDTGAMRARAAELRANGAEPTIVDTTNTSGRRTIRAVASGADNSQDTMRSFHEGRAADLPSRISTQARRTMSPDPRTPAEISSEIVKRRTTQANTQFDAVREQPVTLAAETTNDLRSHYGVAAVQEAARRERDPGTRAALQRLAGRLTSTDAPTDTQMTVGMADRISRVLLSQADGAAAGDRDLAATLGGLGRRVRDQARTAVPAYGQALDNFAAESGLNDAAAHGETFTHRNTDEFVTGAQAMTPEENAVARATARRAVERRSGENPGAAPGVARQLADAPEQQARNASLLGPDAVPFQDAMRTEAQRVANAADVNPRTGSQTQGNISNVERVGGAIMEAAPAAHGLAHGNPLPAIGLWLRTRGVNPVDAETLARAVTDPAEHDAVIAAIDRAAGPGAGAALLQYVGKTQLLGTAAAINAGAATSQAQTAGS
jgi:hypothetical protein